MHYDLLIFVSVVASTRACSHLVVDSMKISSYNNTNVVRSDNRISPTGSLKSIIRLLGQIREHCQDTRTQKEFIDKSGFFLKYFPCVPLHPKEVTKLKCIA